MALPNIANWPLHHLILVCQALGASSKSVYLVVVIQWNRLSDYEKVPDRNVKKLPKEQKMLISRPRKLHRAIMTFVTWICQPCEPPPNVPRPHFSAFVASSSPPASTSSMSFFFKKSFHTLSPLPPPSPPSDDCSQLRQSTCATPSPNST